MPSNMDGIHERAAFPSHACASEGDPVSEEQFPEEERARRQLAINRARANVRLEGTILPVEIEEINSRFIRGELSVEEYVRCALETADRLIEKSCD